MKRCILFYLVTLCGLSSNPSVPAQDITEKIKTNYKKITDNTSKDLKNKIEELKKGYDIGLKKAGQAAVEKGDPEVQIGVVS